MSDIQELGKALQGTNFEYLGMPYWDWTRNANIPKIFDGLIFPSPVDRMLDIKLGLGRSNFPTSLPHRTRSVQEWRFSINGKLVQEVRPDGTLMMGNYDLSRDLERAAQSCEKGYRLRGPVQLDGATLKRGVRGLLRISSRFEQFSSLLENGGHSTVHNRLHCLMESTPVSAYDPAFWMHHSFVDKIFALWQLQDKTGVNILAFYQIIIRKKLLKRYLLGN